MDPASQSFTHTEIPAPKRRGRKPKSLSQTPNAQTNILQKQTAKPQENVVLYLKTSLTPSQKQKIKEYGTLN